MSHVQVLAAGDDTVAVVDEPPNCDIHEHLYHVVFPAQFDGATTLPGRPWAYMCAPCFAKHGVGLGLGVGQELVVRT